MIFIEKIFGKKKILNCKTAEEVLENGLFTDEERIRFKIIRAEISLAKEKEKLKEFLKKSKKKIVW